jgi:hypothetical protein
MEDDDDSSFASGDERTGGDTATKTASVTSVSSKTAAVRSTDQRSFLQNYTPVTGMNDVVSRMGAEADG